MNRVRAITVSLVLMLALAAIAQQAKTAHSGAHGMSSDAHLKLLSEKLNLSADQEAKLKPILQQMDEGTRKNMQDESLSREERAAKIKPLRVEADRKMREFLTDEQKKKLDELEHSPHGELHGKTPQ